MGEEDIPLEVQHLNFVYNFIGIVDGLFKVMKDRCHFSGCLEIELVVWKGEPFVFQADIIIRELPCSRRSYFFSCIDAEEDIMCVEVFLVNIM